MAVFDTILKLTRQLYPTGRAFKLAPGSDFEKLHRGLIKSEERAWGDALSILNSALPDNDQFTSDDATAWEKRLGMVINPAVSLATRKQSIIRKMNHPGTIPARQNYLYIQGQLQLAGFNVYVFENRFEDYPDGYITKTFDEIVLDFYGEYAHGEYAHGEIVHGDSGAGLVTKIVNHIDETLDSLFDEGSHLRNTFFICASTLGEFAEVDEDRKNEFRQLILKLKPTQSVGYLLINYT